MTGRGRSEAATGASGIASPDGARLIDDPAELVAFFSDRRAAHVYGLADSEEPFWSASRWFRRDDAVVGVVGLPGSDALTVYAVATRDPAGTLALITALVDLLPAGVLLTGPVGMSDAIRRVRPTAWDGPHVRHELVDSTMIPPIDPSVVRLGPDDADEVVALATTEPGATFFHASMLGDSTFVGVRRSARLVAMAGTHVVSDRLAVAAIGAVYVEPGSRGAGLGRVVTAGVLDALAGRVETVGLNVAAGNRPARVVYESLGFRPILTYDETELA